MYDETAIRWHLESNFYPPLPEGLVPYAVLAQELVADGRGDELLTIEGGTLRDGDRPMTAYELVEDLRLS